MTDAKNRNKRRIYFIDKEFQARFIIKFCLLVIASGILTGAILYFISSKSTTVSIINSRVVVRSTADYLLPVLIQTIAVSLVVVGISAIWLTLFISHKLSGPLYRFKKVMRSLGEGDFTVDFKIRDSDQLQDLADEFNIMIKKIREELSIIKNYFKSLKEKIGNEAPDEKQSCLQELKKITEDINRVINYFKI